MIVTLPDSTIILDNMFKFTREMKTTMVKVSEIGQQMGLVVPSVGNFVFQSSLLRAYIG